jgi:succinoglycan biosynthesis transport protein ExoP
MEIQLLTRLIRRNVWVILLSIMISVGFSTFITIATQPIYEARAKLFVSTPSSFFDINSLTIGSSFGQQRVKSYAQIVSSPINLAPVIAELGLSISTGDLARQIKATAPADTVLLEIRVRDTTPSEASLIANAVANQFKITVATVEVGLEQSSPISTSIVEEAVTPTAPISPRKTLNLLGGIFFGFSLGIVLSFIRLALDNVVKNEGDLEGRKLLAAILFEPSVVDDLIGSVSNTFSFRAENFRLLRTNVIHLTSNSLPPKKKVAKSILISSSHSAEGKTSTSITLAHSLAVAGNRVLLVEADLRRPTIKKLLTGYSSGVKTKNVGLVDLLRNSVTVSSVTTKTSVKGLFYISSGDIPDNPSELLASTYTRQFHQKICTGYDYVVIDTPPLLAVNDALSIAPYCDLNLLVIKAGTTRLSHYRRTLMLLEGIGISLSGVILNMIPEAKSGEDYGYGYGIKYGYSKNSIKYGKYLTEYVPQEEYTSRQL